jgi:hypothetical protein
MLAVLGLLGIGGVTAAAIFVPGVSALAGTLGGALLRCKPCLIVVAGIALWIWGDIHGHRKSDATCAANDIAMQLKASQRDAAIQADAAKFAQSEVDDLAKANTELSRKVSEYEAAPHTACPLGDRADKLRAIAPR